MDWRGEARRLADQLENRGIGDQRVLRQIAAVPRHLFVPEELRDSAYDDRALEIGRGQTISQPYIVAIMTEAAQLKPASRVLEIGTGSGYQGAILAGLCAHVVSIERIAHLAEGARRCWEQLGITNIVSVLGDGTEGWPESAPYDAILVTAGAPTVPRALQQQLADGGRLVIPVGPENAQELLVHERRGHSVLVSKLCDCRFVKLLGTAGWPLESVPTDGDGPA